MSADFNLIDHSVCPYLKFCTIFPLNCQDLVRPTAELAFLKGLRSLGSELQLSLATCLNRAHYYEQTAGRKVIKDSPEKDAGSFKVSSWVSVQRVRQVGLDSLQNLSLSHVAHHRLSYTIWIVNCIVLAITHCRLKLFQNENKCNIGIFCKIYFLFKEFNIFS